MFHIMESTGVVPITILINIVVLLLKPTGGFRPIGLLSFLYALWVKARRFEVQEWDDEHAGFWDDAVAGSSSLQAALRRRLLDETATNLGRASATVLLDMEKYYDSVPWDKLLNFAIEFHYPPC